ncbi:lectin-like domain-containing protein [Kribbella sp. CA-245084]|uniref:GDSL-type esterase/lipase family protein n=1 Tax=Kribbella sp. CA-245084 TaxID=3239940 RepID=UPI003D89BE7C
MTRGGFFALALSVFLTGAAIGEVEPAIAATTQVSFNYPNFSNPSDLIMNAGAVIVGSALRLSDQNGYESRSAWHGTAVDGTQSFESKFTVAMQHGGPDLPADGLAFVIQSAATGTSTVGEYGAGIGYSGISPSVDVEFDDWQNEWDPDANHIAISTNGEVSTPLVLAPPPFQLYGTPLTAWVSYDATAHVLSVYASPSSVKPASPVVSTTVDVGSVLGTAPAYAGFTGGTGSNYQDTDVTSWSFGAPGSPPASGAVYVGMGDSYSSGEGAPNDAYFPETSFYDPETGGQTGCHRSKTAYPLAVASRLGLPGAKWQFVACSGAEIKNVFGANSSYPMEVEGPQIAAVSPQSTKYVTMTMGGNDVGFTDIVTDCTYDPGDVGDGRPGCRKPGRLGYNRAEAGLQDMGDGRLTKLYTAIGLRMAPGGKLIVSGYPRFFGENITRYDLLPTSSGRVAYAACVVGRVKVVGSRIYRVGIEYKDAKWINSIIDRGDQLIENAAIEANAALKPFGVSVVYAPADRYFHSHRLCDANDNWINGAIFNGSNHHPDRRSFHPNTDGQFAYAKAFLAVIPKR